MSRSGYPPWILNRGGLESSGQRPISSIGKTKRIAYYLFFGKKHIFKIFWFLKKSDFSWFFSDFLTIFDVFILFLGFFFGFFGFLLDFFKFFWFFATPFNVNKVTTKSYQGYYWTHKIAKNGPKQHKPFFALRAKKPLAEALRRSKK